MSSILGNKSELKVISIFLGVALLRLVFGVCLVPRRVLADSRATGIFNFTLGVMGRAKRKARLADYDFKMADSNLCKPRGKKRVI